MSGPQVAAAIALAVIGLLLIVISASSRDFGSQSNFADHLSKVGIFVGGAFMLPLVLILLISLVVGFNMGPSP